MIRRPRYIYSIVPQKRINNRQVLKISIVMILGLLYLNKHYYLKTPQESGLMALFGLDKPEPKPYSSSSSSGVSYTDNTPQEAYIPKNYSDIPKLPSSKSLNATLISTDSIKIKTEADTIINVKGLTSPLPQGYNVQYFKDSTTNVVFTGAFQNKDNAERILKRLAQLAVEEAALVEVPKKKVIALERHVRVRKGKPSKHQLHRVRHLRLPSAAGVGADRRSFGDCRGVDELARETHCGTCREITATRDVRRQ